MPFASGTYTLPAGNPVTTLTTISSSWANTTLNDIAAALSTAVLKDGTQTITGNLPMSSFKLTGLGAGSAVGDSLRYEQVFTTATGSLALLGGLFVPAIVSASGAINMVQAAVLTATSTVALGASTGNYAVVSGVATVSSFDTIRAGALRIIEWSGATPLSNSANLILPKSLSLTTVTGQSSIFVSEGAGTWRMLSHFPVKAATSQVFTSGSGTYNTPSGATRLRVRLVGSGGGGAGSGTTAGAGGAGNASTFDTLSGAAGGAGLTTGGGAGGAGTNGDINITGGSGGSACATSNIPGGHGGSSAFGGGGGGGSTSPGNGTTAGLNSGGGGGGAGSSTNVNSGGGGGAGGYCEKIFRGPATSYSYGVGAAGTVGTAGTGGGTGGGGAAGVVVVEEFYD